MRKRRVRPFFYRGDFQHAPALAASAAATSIFARPNAARRIEPENLFRRGSVQPLRRRVQTHAQRRRFRPGIDRDYFQIERHADPAHAKE
jgi:hypothetical protein